MPPPAGLPPPPAGAKSAKLEAARKAKVAARPAVKKVSKAFYNTMITDSGGCWLAMSIAVLLADAG